MSEGTSSFGCSGLVRGGGGGGGVVELGSAGTAAVTLTLGAVAVVASSLSDSTEELDVEGPG